jgi:MYXO-CTERM domain-containing protein
VAPAAGGTVAVPGGGAPNADAGVPNDAEPSGAGDDGGCGCRVTGSRGNDPRFFAWIALGLACLARRRQR